MAVSPPVFFPSVEPQWRVALKEWEPTPLSSPRTTPHEVEDPLNLSGPSHRSSHRTVAGWSRWPPSNSPDRLSPHCLDAGRDDDREDLHHGHPSRPPNPSAVNWEYPQKSDEVEHEPDPPEEWDEHLPHSSATPLSAVEESPSHARYPFAVPLLVAVTAAASYVAFLIFYVHYLFVMRRKISALKEIICFLLIAIETVLTVFFYGFFYSLLRSDPGVVPSSPWAGVPQRGFLSYGPGPPPHVGAPTSTANVSLTSGGLQTFSVSSLVAPLLPHTAVEARGGDEVHRTNSALNASFCETVKEGRASDTDGKSAPPPSLTWKPPCGALSTTTVSDPNPAEDGRPSGLVTPSKLLSRDADVAAAVRERRFPALFNPYTVYWREEEVEVESSQGEHHEDLAVGGESTGPSPHKAAGKGRAARGQQREPQKKERDRRGRSFLTSRLRYCLYCEQYMPDRAYHCLQCRQCVLLYDHHCDITNTCVGQKNYKIFFAFVLVSLIYCIFSLVVMLLGIFYYRGAGATRFPWSLCWLPVCVLCCFWLLFCALLVVNLAIVGIHHGLTAEEFVRWRAEIKKRHDHLKEREQTAAEGCTGTVVVAPAHSSLDAEEQALEDDGSWPDFPPRYPLYLLRHEPEEARQERIAAFRRIVFGDRWRWWDLLVPTPPLRETSRQPPCLVREAHVI